ncbi:nuclear transport factor 2 family protein [Kitasatospora aureofaciens]|uniref:nuclear transport factor 2 family protein n=1 Tax=Kitasatospora aureofaciens TaxID=1894 RepID=UPI0037CA3DA9
MNDFQAIADLVEIQALQAEFTDAVMMRDGDRLANLFTPDGALRMPNVPIELVGREQITAGREELQARWDFSVQNTHPGSVRIDGDTATGRALMHEIVRLKDGLEGLNYAIYHDRYRRTADGWRFAERVYEVRYVDTSPLGGSAPRDAQDRTAFTAPADAERLARTAAALAARGFAVEILDDAAAARVRIRELIPVGAAVFTAASETLRLSGIDEDLNTDDRYRSVRSRVLTMDRTTEADDIRRLLAAPDVAVGSVAAVTETGSLVIASASGSQLPGNAGGAGQAIWVVGAQKVVPDLACAQRRLEDHVLPLEDTRALAAYGQPSAVNQVLVLNAPTRFSRGTVLLLREAIGY